MPFIAISIALSSCDASTQRMLHGFDAKCQKFRAENMQQRLPYHPDYLILYTSAYEGNAIKSHPEYACIYSYCEYIHDNFNVATIFEYNLSDLRPAAQAQASNRNLPSGNSWPETVQFTGYYATVYRPYEYCQAFRNEAKTYIPMTSNKSCVYMEPVKLSTDKYYKLYAYYKIYEDNSMTFRVDFYSNSNKLVAKYETPTMSIGEGPSPQFCSNGIGTLGDEYKETLVLMLNRGAHDGKPN